MLSVPQRLSRGYLVIKKIVSARPHAFIFPSPPQPPEETKGSFSNGDGNENVKTAIGIIKQNNKFARVSRFFVHFFAVSARLGRENA